jgi:hypothetical protein
MRAVIVAAALFWAIVVLAVWAAASCPAWVF